MVEFIPIASGSTGNCYTVFDGQTKIMLDIGIPWKKIQRALSFKTSDVAGVLISHGHGDHVKYAKDAMKMGIDIYCSQETADMAHLGGHRLNIIKANEQFKVGTWTIYPFAVVHDVEGALGYYMANKAGEAFLYLTDSAYSPVRFKDLVCIAVECNFVSDLLTENILEGRIPWFVGKRIRHSHLSLETFIGLLKANDTSKLREVWMLHMSSGNADEIKMVKEVQRTLGVPTYAA